MKCPSCGKEISSTWHINSNLIHCESCGAIFSSGSDDIMLKSLTRFKNSTVGKSSKVVVSENQLHDMDFSIPDFMTGDRVICIDDRNVKFLDYGEIIKIEHMHARVKFDDEMCIWFGCNVLERVPKEWL